MDNTDWTQLEGMIIAGELDPQAVAKYLAKTGVIAELEWFPRSPNTVGITVAYNGDAVATLAKQATEPTPGPSLISFVEDLAAEFEAEVMIGDMGIDRLPEGVEPEAPDTADGPMRVAEISATPASAVPLLAAFEGLDVADLDLPGGKRVLAVELENERYGWYLGDDPRVTLTYHDGEFQAFLTEDEDPETIVTFNWAMVQKLVAGAAGRSQAVQTIAEDLVGSKNALLRIYDGVPGVDSEKALASTSAEGADAVYQFVEALGLPASIADFLTGSIGLEEIAGSRVHEARGVSNAIGRSVGIMLDDKESNSEVWERYSHRVTEKPWQVPLVSALETAVGVSVIGVGRLSQRGWVRALAAVTGALLISDAVAELALSQYVRARNDRRAQRLSELQTPGIPD